MTAIFAWPSELKVNDAGLALTFVVPASACNLACDFCAITNRKEIHDTRLTVSDYVYFLSDIAKREPLSIVAIQGYEPLLPEAWKFTKAILSAAREFGVPRSIVTNGILLHRRAHELADLSPTGVTVSIDSFIAAEHDKLRGRVGAFTRTVAGVRALTEIKGFKRKVTVSSVLFPGHRHLLGGMPELLADMGVKNWAVSPLLQFGTDAVGGPVDHSNNIVEDLHALSVDAAKCGISIILSDELNLLPSDDYSGFLIRRFERPDGLVRLSPSGACSVGKEILRTINSDTHVWEPASIMPHEFLLSILSPTMKSRLFRTAA